MKIILYKFLLLTLFLTTINSEPIISIGYETLLHKGAKVSTKDISNSIIRNISLNYDSFTFSDIDNNLENTLNNNQNFLENIIIIEDDTKFTILLKSEITTIKDSTNFIVIDIYIVKANPKYLMDIKEKVISLSKDPNTKSINIKFQITKDLDILKVRKESKPKIVQEELKTVLKYVSKFSTLSEEVEEYENLEFNINKIIRQIKESINLKTSSKLSMSYFKDLEDNFKRLETYVNRVDDNLEYLIEEKYPLKFKKQANLLILKFKEILINTNELSRKDEDIVKTKALILERIKNEALEDEVEIEEKSVVKPKILKEEREIEKKTAAQEKLKTQEQTFQEELINVLEYRSKFFPLSAQAKEYESIESNIERIIKKITEALTSGANPKLIMDYIKDLEDKLEKLEIYEETANENIEYLMKGKYPLKFKKQVDSLILEFQTIMISIEELFNKGDNLLKTKKLILEIIKNEELEDDTDRKTKLKKFQEELVSVSEYIKKFSILSKQSEEYQKFELNIEEIIVKIREAFSSKRSSTLITEYISTLDNNLKTLEIYEDIIDLNLEYLNEGKYPLKFKKQADLLVLKFKEIMINIDELFNKGNNLLRASNLALKRIQDDSSLIDKSELLIEIEEAEEHLKYSNKLREELLNIEDFLH